MKNLNIVPVSLIVLAIAFVVVSVMVYFTRGKNKYFLTKKLKIGAMIITLTAVTNGCRVPVVTCYKPAPPPRIMSLQATESLDEIRISKDEKLLNFDLEYIYSSDVCYTISQNEKIINKGDCEFVSDGETDMVINMNENLLPGKYDLKIYQMKISELGKKDYPLSTFTIVVTESK
ncbi:MAG TPA: hypothetical protein PKN32_12515 [Bacteroidales bacterium]|nr:hypothetical protein [Bacteroidales bacterium]